MALFQKGVSGNLKGRPKGTGKTQLKKQQELQEKLMQKRLKNALSMLDNIERERHALIEAYIMGDGGYEYLDS
jgi:hypothetical protein